MKLDELKSPWMTEVSIGSSPQRLDVLQSDVARLRRDVFMRDFWLIVPLLAAAGGSAFFNWETSQVAVLSTVFFALGVTVVLLMARRTKSRDHWTLRARLEREVEKLGRQASLLLNVGYWFILPMLLTIVITSLVGQHERTGTYVPNAVSWGLYLASVSVAAITVWLCRREAKRTFLPLLSRLKELHHDLVAER